jgi:hypothetical protein
MQSGRGMALRWIYCGAATYNIAALHRNLRFTGDRERPCHTGFACVPGQHLCLSVDICVHLGFYFFLRLSRAGHDRGATGKSQGKHRYTQISTDRHRWTSGQISLPDAHHGMEFDARLVASPQFIPDLA